MATNKCPLFSQKKEFQVRSLQGQVDTGRVGTLVSPCVLKQRLWLALSTAHVVVFKTQACVARPPWQGAITSCIGEGPRRVAHRDKELESLTVPSEAWKTTRWSSGESHGTKERSEPVPMDKTPWITHRKNISITSALRFTTVINARASRQ